jgi:hypothetical protein
VQEGKKVLDTTREVIETRSIKLLDSPKVPERCRVVQTLAQIRNERAMEPILIAADDEGGVRGLAWCCRGNGVVMPSLLRRFFLCTGQCVTADQLTNYPHSHIMGELRYVTDEGRKVTALALYEQSVSAVHGAPSVSRPVRVELIGDARKIKCTLCERVERWEIGKAAFLVLMQRYGKVVV